MCAEFRPIRISPVLVKGPVEEYYLLVNASLKCSWYMNSISIGYLQPGWRFFFKGYIGATMPDYSRVQHLMTASEERSAAGMYPAERLIARCLSVPLEKAILTSWQDWKRLVEKAPDALIVTRSSDYGHVSGEGIKFFPPGEFITLVERSRDGESIPPVVDDKGFKWTDEEGFSFARFPSKSECLDIINLRIREECKLVYSQDTKNWEARRTIRKALRLNKRRIKPCVK